MAAGARDRPIQIVDEANRPVGEASRADMHRRRLVHRAVHCLVHDGRGRVYLSQRDDVICRDRYDISLTEHVWPGESFTQTAERGLARRLGLEAAGAKPLGQVFRDLDVHPSETEGEGELTDDRFMQIFVARHPGPVRPDPRVYKGGEWRTVADVDRLVESEPGRFTPHFLKDWSRIRADLDALVGPPVA